MYFEDLLKFATNYISIHQCTGKSQQGLFSYILAQTAIFCIYIRKLKSSQAFDISAYSEDLPPVTIVTVVRKLKSQS